ncbi:hypothetical protein QBC39DRAFT_246816 [Podospora conica]|nr:hypothetical protein QBC39DRAFT_246816 [Schizothecium conicum]
MIPAPLLARQSQESPSTPTVEPTASPPPATTLPAPTNAIDPWVTVDESGKPKTITPVLTTISGTPTIISGAPYEVTGTVFTQTRDAKLTTSTGSSPPQATHTDGSGAFAICNNKDPDAFAPFCEPKNNVTLNPGITHYITWDPTFFPPNSTVRVVGFYNATTTDEAFSSDLLPSAWGFYQWTLTPSLYLTPPHHHPSGVNITLRIAALPPGGGARTWVPGPTVLVAPKRAPPPVKSAPPTGPALYIGLPCILGFIVLVVGGTCWWNRRERRIGVGNVMGRGRGGYGVGKSRRERLMGRNKKKDSAGIRLDEPPRGRTVYRDEPPVAVPVRDDDGWGDDSWRREPIVGGGIPRRDSDALGSLAGSPTKETFGGGNVFREELERQQESREFRAKQEKRTY